MWRAEGGLLSSLPDDMLLCIYVRCPLSSLGRLARSCKRQRAHLYADELWCTLRSSAPWALSSATVDDPWDSGTASRFSSVRLLVRHEIEVERRWRSGCGHVATLPLQRCAPHEKIIEAASASLSHDSQWIVVTGERPPMLQVWRAAPPHVLTHSVRGRPFDRFNCRLLPAANGSEFWRALSTDRRKQRGALYMWEVRPKSGRAADGAALRRVKAVAEAATTSEEATQKPQVLAGHHTRLSGAALDAGTSLLSTTDEHGVLCVWHLANPVPRCVGCYKVGVSLESIAMGRLDVWKGGVPSAPPLRSPPAGGGGSAAPAAPIALGRQEHRVAIALGGRDGVIRLLEAAVTVTNDVMGAASAAAVETKVPTPSQRLPAVGEAPHGVAVEGAEIPSAQGADKQLVPAASPEAAPAQAELPELLVTGELRLEGHTDWVTHLELHGAGGEGGDASMKDGDGDRGNHPASTTSHESPPPPHAQVRSPWSRSKGQHAARTPPRVAPLAAEDGHGSSTSTARRRTKQRAGGGEVRVLLSGSRDHTVRSWSLQPGVGYATPLQVFSGHTRWINRMTLGHVGGPSRVGAAEGEGSLFIVSASADATLMVWRLSDGARLGVLKGHRLQVTDFDLRGTRLVSTSLDGTIRAWELRPLLENAPPVRKASAPVSPEPMPAPEPVPVSPLPSPAGTPTDPAAIAAAAATAAATVEPVAAELDGPAAVERAPSAAAASTEAAAAQIMCISESAMEHAGPVRFVSFDRECIVSCGDEGRVCVVGFWREQEHSSCAMEAQGDESAGAGAGAPELSERGA